jgi:hypothetical protein
VDKPAAFVVEHGANGIAAFCDALAAGARLSLAFAESGLRGAGEWL